MPSPTRAMRIIADHVRGSVQLIADGVVPSNERRGYVLRRIMRRAIHQGRVLGLEAPYLGRFAERAIEMLAPVNPALVAERDTIMRWIGSEEESFGRTLDRGSQLLDRLIGEALGSGTSWISAEDAFELHDTYGFPYDLTRELVAERGLSVDDEGFEELMEQQRERARSRGGVGGGEGDHDRVIGFVGAATESRFVGYEDLRTETGVVAVAPADGLRGARQARGEPVLRRGRRSGRRHRPAPLERWRGRRRRRLPGRRRSGAEGPRRRPRGRRHGSRPRSRTSIATRRCATTPPPTCSTPPCASGSAPTSARPARRSAPTSCASTSPTAAASAPRTSSRSPIGSTAGSRRARPVRAIEMDRREAERLGAMALFGEKYGDWVRVVEVEGVSRELCGGTHVANTAEIGIFEILSEGSSASNVRRIEAVTGPVAIDLYRERSAELARAAEALGGRDAAAAAERLAARLRELEAAAADRGAEAAGNRAAELAAGAETVDGIGVVVGELGELPDARALLGSAHDIKSRIGDAAVVLAATSGEKVSLVGVFSPAAVERGLSAADVVREAAGIVGGGGGGKPEVAQAGGRHVEKIGDALNAAREAVLAGLGGGR